MSDAFWLPDPKGHDPFDALLGRRVPDWVRRSPRGRQAAIQLRKRLPIDIGGLLGVAPFVMAKTVGCLLWAEARASAASDARSAERAEHLVGLLDDAGGNAGSGAWGYEFDVQTRWAFYAAGSPNVIATSFVGRGLLAAGVTFGRADWLEQGAECAGYVRANLLRTSASGRPAIHYTPATTRLIHNANLLGCALLVDALTADAGDATVGVLDDALEAARTTIDAQADDGSWPYGEATSLRWVDSFHTAYNLDGLLQVWLATSDERVLESLRRGTDFWASHFFGPGGEPYYYAGSRLPYDIHSASTAVDVGCRLASWGLVDAALPRRVAEWTRSNLINPATGRTYYRRGRLFTDKRHFARWGDAHWAMARASLAMVDSASTDPLEARVKGAL